MKAILESRGHPADNEQLKSQQSDSIDRLPTVIRWPRDSAVQHEVPRFCTGQTTPCSDGATVVGKYNRSGIFTLIFRSYWLKKYHSRYDSYSNLNAYLKTAEAS